MNYHDIAFTDAVKDIQQKNGSRDIYRKMKDQLENTGLSVVAKQMIEDRDSFYMATSGENGFPYIQHRGGPRGFLKVLDDSTIGFLDFRGNKQYISIGNLQNNQKVALILMDYARQTRLKVYAEAEIQSLDDKKLVQTLSLEEYKYHPERIILLHIKAFDWNCPQHIKPRFTEDEVQKALDQQAHYIATLESEIKKLRK